MKLHSLKRPILYTVISLLAPLVIILLTELISKQDVAAAFGWLTAHGRAVLFEYLLLLAVEWLFFGAFGKLWCGFLISALAALLITLTNFYKIQINGMPLLVSDFSFAGHAKELVNYALPHLTVSEVTFCALSFSVLTCALCAVLDAGHRLGVWHRLSVGTLAAVYLGLLFTGIFSGWCTDLSGGMNSQEERMGELGVITGLTSALLADEVHVDADEAMRSEILAESALGADSAKPAVKPTVVFLMSESFFDVTELDGVTFKNDPVPTFHALEGGSTSGSFITNTFSGGTGFVEMEVLTALCSGFLNESDNLTTLPDETYNTLPCLSDSFKAEGYSTTFLHSHTDSLYNRRTIYNNLGFDNVLFSDSFPEDAGRSGGYISDMALTEKIVDICNSSNDPQMIFAVSMENHQPFTLDKYGEDTYMDFSAPELTQEAREVLGAYVTGANHADAALDELIKYFEQQGKPVMLVFWGDHLPNMSLSDGSTVYTQTGYVSKTDTTLWSTAELEKMLKTNYLIWTNYEDSPAPDGDQSSMLLGASVLSRLGINRSDYFRWINSALSPDVLMYRARIFVDGQGESFADIPEDRIKLMEKYEAIVRSYAYGEADIFPKELCLTRHAS